jgi:alpha-tubulin suppressor-like RCC1 family protein
VLIIGLELPGGPHAVTLGRDGTVWSWGEPWEFPDAVVEEVWAVTWS